MTSFEQVFCSDRHIGLLKTRNTLEKILAENSGQSIEKVHADAERDNWMSAQETLEYGFC